MQAGTARIVSLALLLAGAAAAAHGADGRVNQANEPVAIDEIAQQIFTAADRNHNDVLSKSEFGRAHAALVGQLNQLGQQGRIGKQYKKKKQSSAAPVDSEAAADKLARSNKVSLAQFVLYAHSALAEADDSWRQLRQDNEAQHKLQQQMRKAGRRGRSVFGLPFQPGS